MNEEKEIIKLGESLHKLDEFVEFPDSVSPKEVRKMLGNREKKIYKYLTTAACILLTVSIVGIAAMIPVSLFGTSKPKESDVENYGIQKTAESYDEVYKKINDFNKQQRILDRLERLGELPEAVLSGGAKYDNMDMEESNDVSYTGADASTTNLQVEGVDEADIIKNDDRYIYYLTDNRIIVMDAINPQSPVKIADFQFAEQEEADNQNMFLLPDKKLIVIWNESKLKTDEAYSYSMKQQTCVTIYNIENPSEPAVERKFSQDGIINDSRMVDSCLYVISNIYNVSAENKSKVEEYVPSVSDSATGESGPVKCGNIILPEQLNSTSYAVVTAIDITVLEKKAETKAVLGRADIVYATAENLYILSENCNGDENATIIQRFNIKDGKVDATGSVKVPGAAINQFAVDEYNGYLRIGVTVVNYSNTMTAVDSNQSNSLFVFDSDLKLCGSVIGIAPTESIYSMRYEGDRAYMVTFRQTDPLYAIDLSEPKNPKIIGKLKIPGFSQYMHPVGDGLMLGIGRNANESTGRTENGIKLSLFDVTGDTPKEIYVTMLFEDYDWSDSKALYNHKNFVDLGNNKYGFDFNTSNWGEESNCEKGFVVIKIENSEIKVDKIFEKTCSYDSETVRGVRIKDSLILVDDMGAQSYLIDNYEKKSELVF